MSKKSLRKQYNILTVKINTIEKKEMDFCGLSINGKNVEKEWTKLQLVKFDLEIERNAVIRQLNKPSIFRRRAV